MCVPAKKLSPSVLWESDCFADILCPVDMFLPLIIMGRRQQRPRERGKSAQAINSTEAPPLKVSKISRPLNIDTSPSVHWDTPPRTQLSSFPCSVLGESDWFDDYFVFCLSLKCGTSRIFCERGKCALFISSTVCPPFKVRYILSRPPEYWHRSSTLGHSAQDTAFLLSQTSEASENGDIISDVRDMTDMGGIDFPQDISEEITNNSEYVHQ